MSRGFANVVVGMSIGVAGLAASSTPAAAQGKWEIEGRGGLAWGSTPSGGAGTLPPPGVTFAAINGFPSRRISSWYFGDGALLFDQYNYYRGSTLRITHLDEALNLPATHRKSSVAAGVRIGRTLTERVSADFTFDVNFGSMAFTPEAIRTIQGSQNSYTFVWQKVLQGFAGFSDSSHLVTVDHQGRQFFLTGTVGIDLRGKGSVRPFLTFGAGMAIDSGENRVSLAGNYQFLAGAPINESDNVEARYTAGRSFVTVAGGGLKRELSERSGLRLDLRLLMSKDPAQTFVSATPVVAIGSPTTTVALPVSPSLQFSTVTGINSSLSGPAITEFRTFNGGSIRLQFALTLGYFRRF